ncbi:MAG: hypothetical protein COA88_07195 [Kordia sp.]|nr:MAG: hypothetical protein COA88_07195 [Kordia sp.]
MKCIIVIINLVLFFNCNNCKIDFESTGLKNYTIGISLEELKKSNPDLIDKFNSKMVENVHVYSLVEKCLILGEQKEVTYNFAFVNNKLEAYVFNINAGRKISFYRKFIEKSKKNNDFINGTGTSFLKKENDCEKFLRMNSGKSEIVIFGGISRLDYYW